MCLYDWNHDTNKTFLKLTAPPSSKSDVDLGTNSLGAFLRCSVVSFENSAAERHRSSYDGARVLVVWGCCTKLIVLGAFEVASCDDVATPCFSCAFDRTGAGRYRDVICKKSIIVLQLLWVTVI